MDHNVIHVPAERDAGVFPVHPRIEGIVGSPRGISPRGSHGTERDSLPSLRSSHPLHFGSDLLTRLLPGQRLVARAKQITDEPAPSLRFHYRSFSATTSRSASVPASVLNASQFLLLDALPLATHHPFGQQIAVSDTPSHVPCSSRRPDSRHLHTGHRLAGKRIFRQAYPEVIHTPRF